MLRCDMRRTTSSDDSEERQLLVVSRMGSSDSTTVLNMDDVDESVGADDSVGGGCGSSGVDTPALAAAAGPSEAAKGRPAESEEEFLHRLRFEAMLRRSHEEDLTSVEDTNCIYRAGCDRQGRAVIVFIGKWFRHSQLDLDKALLYLLRVVEPVATKEYVVVYFHTR